MPLHIHLPPYPYTHLETPDYMPFHTTPSHLIHVLTYTSILRTWLRPCTLVPTSLMVLLLLVYYLYSFACSHILTEACLFTHLRPYRVIPTQ